MSFIQNKRDIKTLKDGSKISFRQRQVLLCLYKSPADITLRQIALEIGVPTLHTNSIVLSVARSLASEKHKLLTCVWGSESRRWEVKLTDKGKDVCSEL